MIRFYISTLIGTGTDTDPFRPALSALSGLNWSADDGRVDQTLGTGWMVAWADVDSATHSAISALAGVTWIPFSNSLGTPLDPSDIIGNVASANRTLIRTNLEANHIPTDDLSVLDPIRKVVARIIRRIRIRRALAANDFTESLDALVSSLSTSRRNSIRTALTNVGYDFSTVLGTDTIRQAIQKLAAQNVAYQRNGWD